MPGARTPVPGTRTPAPVVRAGRDPVKAPPPPPPAAEKVPASAPVPQAPPLWKRELRERAGKAAGTGAAILAACGRIVLAQTRTVADVGTATLAGGARAALGLIRRLAPLCVGGLLIFFAVKATGPRVDAWLTERRKISEAAAKVADAAARVAQEKKRVEDESRAAEEAKAAAAKAEEAMKAAQAALSAEAAKTAAAAAAAEAAAKAVVDAKAAKVARAAEEKRRQAEALRARSTQAGIRWVPIPGGSFLMGSGKKGEGPAHQVAVDGFQMTKTLVTNKQYRVCADAKACTPPHRMDGSCQVNNGTEFVPGNLPKWFQDDNQPVVCVDWNQAQAFARWVGGRLPSEAEWEYAARSAGRNYAYPWGDEAATCAKAVIYETDGGAGCGRNMTWPVCSKPDGNTAQGLCDMAGNVLEWLQDRFHGSYAGAPEDGSAWESPPGADRVLRGGSWYYSGGNARATYRVSAPPGSRDATFGFRVAR